MEGGANPTWEGPEGGHQCPRHPNPTPPAVRNDRSKRKREVKEDLGADELSPELAELVQRVSRAHQETFPSLGQLGKYTTVSRAGLWGHRGGTPTLPPALRSRAAPS